jgi:hypothetical protein
LLKPADVSRLKDDLISEDKAAEQNSLPSDT